MNKKYTDYIDKKADRNIDVLIDDSMRTARNRKYIRRVSSSIMSVFAIALSFFALINTSGQVQAFVLQNEILKPFVQPFIINNIFEEVETSVYEDELIKLELVLNNFEIENVERVKVDTSSNSKELDQVSTIDGSDNYRYYVSFYRDYPGPSDPYKAIYEYKNGDVQLIHEFKGIIMGTSPVLGFNDAVYYLDIDPDKEPNEGNPLNYFIYENGTKRKIRTNDAKYRHYGFFISNDVPYAIHMVREENQEGYSFGAINLETLEEVSLNIDPNLDGIHGTTFEFLDGTTLVKTRNRDNDPILQARSNTFAKEFIGYREMLYRLVSDSLIYGQETYKIDSSSHKFHVINLITDEVYYGDDTSTVFNLLSNHGRMVAVMKLNTTDVASLEVRFHGDASNIYHNETVTDAPSEILMVGNHRGLQLYVTDEATNQSYKYIIRYKQ